MNRKIFNLPLMIAALAVMMLAACKKEDDDDSISAEDNSSVVSALETATDDAANAIGGMASMSGKTEAGMAFCGLSIDSSQKSSGIITLNYDGTGCTGLARTGSITITLLNYANGVRWRDAGATLQIDFNSLQVTKTVSGAYCTLNGTHYLTNVSGGLAWKVMNASETGTVTHRHAADNFSVTFADGSQRIWSVRRIRSFTNSGSVRTVTLAGDTTLDGVAGVDVWGTNRRGSAFTGALLSPVVSNTDCGLYKPVSGEYTHHVANRSLNILYGTDAQGDAVGAGSCAYGFKITFTKNNHSRTRVVSYWF